MTATPWVGSFDTKRMLARVPMHFGSGGFSGLQNAAIISVALLVLLYLVMKMLRVVFRVLPTPAGESAPHFLRLGQFAPADKCYCEAGQSSGRTYQDCCRSKDIEKLEADVRSYNWHEWTKKSYAGRRWTRSMQDRLEEYPLPPVILPEWVTSPEKHTFPVADEMLRTWRPPGLHEQSDELVGQDDPLGLGF